MSAVPSLAPAAGRVAVRTERRRRRRRQASSPRHPVPMGASVAAARGAIWLLTD